MEVTDAGVRAVCSLPALTFLDLSFMYNVTAAGVQALRNTTAAPNLEIKWAYWAPPSYDDGDELEYWDSDESDDWEY
jgi:hypothetical protein